MGLCRFQQSGSVFPKTLEKNSGMGYYTGTIFEIKTDSFSGSIGGGGRYDNMIKKYTGDNVKSVGISIGFERIMQILLDNNY